MTTRVPSSVQTLQPPSYSEPPNLTITPTQSDPAGLSARRRPRLLDIMLHGHEIVKQQRRDLSIHYPDGRRKTMRTQGPVRSSPSPTASKRPGIQPLLERSFIILSTQKLLDENLWVFRAALLQDDLSVTGSCRLVHQVSGLLELAEDVLTDDLGV
jgi:hypothetical protein